MKKLVCTLALLMLPMALFGASARPVALLFPVTPDKDTSPQFATEMTQAIKLYVRQTGRADIVDFDVDSALVQRAIHEHDIDSTDLVSVSKLETRMKLAEKLNADMVVSGDLSIKADKITVSVLFAPVHSKKSWKVDSTVEIPDTGDHASATSNAIQSATSNVVGRLAAEVLKDVKPDQSATQPPVTDSSTSIPTTEPDPTPTATPEDEVGTHVGKADDYLKEGDEASAIVEYRRAINADPKDIDLRLKLINLYVQRKMYTEAIDDLQRARVLFPDNEDLVTELAKIFDESGSPEKAVEIFEGEADRSPKDVAARLKVGDLYWQHGQVDQAEKQYRVAMASDPKAQAPHERLALVLVSKSMYDEGRAEMLKLQQLQHDQETGSVTPLYSRFRSITDRDINLLVVQLEAVSVSFENKEKTREVCYDTVRQIGTNIDTIGSFLQSLNPPDVESLRHKRQMLGCSLVSQACASTLSYLETNKDSEKDDADIFLSEAKKQLSGQ